MRLRAFAKINLCLHILGKRPDGYHELRTIFQAIGLCDELRLELTRGRKDELTLYSPGFNLTAEERTALSSAHNLVWRAIDALRKELQIHSRIRVELVKRIPLGRGLGGGSSDAAAALLGFLRLTGRELAAPRLVEIAASLGADVPFFLFGGRALGVGRGDEIYPLPEGPRQSVLVVSPPHIAVNTPEAYGWVSRELTTAASAHKLWNFCALCWSLPGAGVSNDFEAAVFRRHPRLAAIKGELLKRGAAEAALAGSGSAVFGIFPSPAQARRAAQGFPNDLAFASSTLSRAECRRARFRPGRA